MGQKKARTPSYQQDQIIRITNVFSWLVMVHIINIIIIIIIIIIFICSCNEQVGHSERDSKLLDIHVDRPYINFELGYCMT